MSNKKLTDFVSAIKGKGLPFEVHDVPETGFKKIGVNYGKGSWHWFTWFTLSNGIEYLDFDHTYSQINGKTKKGLRHRMAMHRSIERKLGIDLYCTQ